jgi:hypothetical protein
MMTNNGPTRALLFCLLALPPVSAHALEVRCSLARRIPSDEAFHPLGRAMQPGPLPADREEAPFIHDPVAKTLTIETPTGSPVSLYCRLRPRIAPNKQSVLYFDDRYWRIYRLSDESDAPLIDENASQPAYTPDSQFVIFTREMGIDSDHDIPKNDLWIHVVATGEARPLTTTLDLSEGQPKVTRTGDYEYEIITTEYKSGDLLVYSLSVIP